MSNQLSFIDEEPAPPKGAKAPSRKSDPASSKEAGASMERGAALAQEALCEALVYAQPGATIHELAKLSKRLHKKDALDSVKIGKRLPYIATVKAGEVRKCKVSGRKCQTWNPCDENEIKDLKDD